VLEPGVVVFAGFLWFDFLTTFLEVLLLVVAVPADAGGLAGGAWAGACPKVNGIVAAASASASKLFFIFFLPGGPFHLCPLTIP
jgi:hypothetical protein